MQARRRRTRFHTGGRGAARPVRLVRRGVGARGPKPFGGLFGLSRVHSSRRVRRRAGDEQRRARGRTTGARSIGSRTAARGAEASASWSARAPGGRRGVPPWQARAPGGAEAYSPGAVCVCKPGGARRSHPGRLSRQGAPKRAHTGRLMCARQGAPKRTHPGRLAVSTMTSVIWSGRSRASVPGKKMRAVVTPSKSPSRREQNFVNKPGAT